MAGDYRTTSDLVAFSRALQAQPYKFGFFAALRRLECAYRQKPRLGRSLRPADEPVRLAQDPSLAFAPSTVASFEPGPGGRPPRLAVNFLGLFGPNGPLPLHLTEYAWDRLHNQHDPTFSRFLDLFHHRMLTLFYRAWADAQPTVNFDRPESDRFAIYLGASFGLGLPSLRDRDAMPDLAKRSYAGHLACHTRHPEGLTSLLEDFFKLRVRIIEFVGHWLALPADSHWSLGASLQTGRLGQTATVGARVWDRQHKFRIKIGPMDLFDYERLLPGGESLVRLVACVRNYIGDELLWDLNLVLKKQEVPSLRLGGIGRLGWTTWLPAGERQEDADDLLLNPPLPGQ